MVPVVTVPIWVPLRNTLYPVTPTVSVEAFQERLIWVEDTTVAESPDGIEGEVVSGAGMMVAEHDAVVPPLLPRQLQE